MMNATNRSDNTLAVESPHTAAEDAATMVAHLLPCVHLTEELEPTAQRDIVKAILRLCAAHGLDVPPMVKALSVRQ